MEASLEAFCSQPAPPPDAAAVAHAQAQSKHQEDQLVAIQRADTVPSCTGKGDSLQLTLMETAATPQRALAPLARSRVTNSASREAAPLQLTAAAPQEALAPLARSIVANSARREASPLQLTAAVPQEVLTPLPRSIVTNTASREAAPLQLALANGGGEEARASGAVCTPSRGKENALVPQAWSQATATGGVGHASAGSDPLQLSLANGGEGEFCTRLANAGFAPLPLVMLK